MQDLEWSNADSAFELLLEQFEVEISLMTAAGARIAAGQEFDLARDHLDLSAQITALRSELLSLRERWYQAAHAIKRIGDPGERTARRPSGSRIGSQVRTGTRALAEHALAVMHERKRGVSFDDLAAAVHIRIRADLKPLDEMPLLLAPEIQRWRNTLQWGLHDLVQAGLLAPDDAPHTWRLTEAGLWQSEIRELEVGATGTSGTAESPAVVLGRD